MPTAFHAAWWAHRLTLQGPPGSMESIARSLASARVDLNPHQVDAALFALTSPLQRGVLLADEVGLGKTIEAGLVLAQRWAERRRRLLLIVPATLRKQWQQELADKFHVPSRIVDGPSIRRLPPHADPFDDPASVVIASYELAASRAEALAQVRWDLVVLDEAHRLRNVWRPKAKIASRVRTAIGDRPKLLLTATPLQNSLLELYGLVSFIDPWVFADVDSFREQFVRPQNETLRNARLRARLQPICRRTLRRQVVEYVRFTNRIPITQRFVPTEAEHQLYEVVSAYLQRDILHALPSGQRSLLILVLRKLLASSTHAIAGTLRRMVHRVERQVEALLDDEDLEGLDELVEEWGGGEAEVVAAEPVTSSANLRAELEELRVWAELAESIEHNAKASALLLGLDEAFSRAEALGAARKAVVFTESRRTQAYLARFLEGHGYVGEIVQINGSNADPASRATFAAWLERHRGSDRISGSRAADVKAALVEEFRDRGTILIATESAAEGVNLQFCSLVVNYDLPWNPQRIEQRIGRCHRYGQRHDVVVVNFLNERNAADVRVHQLLSEKFRLFEGVFGASDEILGAVESGIDLERRIAEVYQTCRSPAEIDAAFDALQAELAGEIDTTMKATRQVILEHFDAEVHERLKNLGDDAARSLRGHQAWLWRLACFELEGRANFDEPRKCFDLPGDDRRAYYLHWPLADDEDGVFFHPEDPLALELIERARQRPFPARELVLRYDLPRRVALEPHLGRSGVLELVRLSLRARHLEEHLIVVARFDDGTSLPADVAAQLLELPGHLGRPCGTDNRLELSEHRDLLTAEVGAEAELRSRKALLAEEAKLEDWAEDAKAGLERELKDLDREIRESRKLARQVETLDAKLEAQKAVRDLEARRSRKRRELFAAQDEIEAQRDQLIARIEGILQLEVDTEVVFGVRFRLEDSRAALDEITREPPARLR
jgi:adenine-specific DNA-methyltransferase